MIEILGIEITASDIIAFSAFLVSGLTYICNDRKINKQSRVINSSQIKRDKEEEENKMKADLKAESNKLPDGTRKLFVYNIGEGIAKNIRIEFEELKEPDGILVKVKKLPYPFLNYKDEFALPMQITSSVKKLPIIKLIWDDEFGMNREKMQVIDL